MFKFSTFRNAFIPTAMLLLSGIFLQSCVEEMPILKPSDVSKTVSTNSTIVVNVNKSVITLKNTNPGYVFFASATVGIGANNTQYDISGSNGLQTNAVDFDINFNLNSTSKKYVLLGSQLNFNNKSYTTVYNGMNGIEKAKLTFNKIDTIANTANGSYAYYLYDSAFTPTDSIYVSGTFNIVK
ncbi:hypothetical protein EON73_04515 [bacterium]|nr:MAG: hypothetical protein EON73_04515 [bacterium]